MSMTELVKDLPTPCLLLDRSKLDANISRMSKRIGSLGGVLRPHVKTHKSIDVAKVLLAHGNVQGITVSTLAEAEYFHQNGISDILYGVCIAPNKLAQSSQLVQQGCDLKVVIDSVETAQLIIEYSQANKIPFNVLIELDTDGHRSGLKPKSTLVVAIAEMLQAAEHVQFVGVMTHAGESYHCANEAALLKIAKQERDLSLLAVSQLNKASIPCPIVSIGSTPTAFAIDNLDGISEVRAGVYTFFDLVMCGVGVCQPDDIAISVLSSVIGFQKEKNWIITDAGWMALSRDRGTAGQEIDYGYGKVHEIDGVKMNSLIVSGANQEHGIIEQQSAQQSKPQGKNQSELPNENQFKISPTIQVGSLVKILPNHACSTASQFNQYYVVEGDKVVATWPRVNGW